MTQPNEYKAGDSDRTMDSAPALRWAEARNVMLTDNADPQDPLSCMDLTVSSWQVDNVRRCIKTLYQGLKWANLLKIKGGYAGQRNYDRLFLIDDAYIIGVFDNRNVLDQADTTELRNPKNLRELIQFYNQGKGNIKTLVVFEKPNLRLANSDEKARQSYFIAETIYPALAAIVQVLNNAESQQNKYLSSSFSNEVKANNNEVQLAKTSDDISQRFLKLSPLFLNLFKDPGQANKLLLQTSPLLLFCNSSSPLNLDIDDDFLADTLSKSPDFKSQDN